MAPKTDHIQIRVTPREKTRLRRLATGAGMDLSAYVLARALPDTGRRFAVLVDDLMRTEQPAFPLAELHDLLTGAAPIEFSALVASGLPAALEPWRANYVAAMVETAAASLRVAPPQWASSVVPLETPWFASPLRGLRSYLLRVSPIAFKRRNLFVDTTLGGRQ